MGERPTRGTAMTQWDGSLEKDQIGTGGTRNTNHAELSLQWKRPVFPVSFMVREGNSHSWISEDEQRKKSVPEKWELH